MKKAIAVLIIVVLLAGMMSISAFAHCGYGRQLAVRTREPRYELCPVEGCDQTGVHEHDGTYYCCRNYGEGCIYGNGCGRAVNP